jgi:citrate synthase
MIKTEIGYTTPDTITVRGKNLATELLGKVDFVDMIILLFYGRLPEEREKVMLNLLLVFDRRPWPDPQRGQRPVDLSGRA